MLVQTAFLQKTWPRSENEAEAEFAKGYTGFRSKNIIVFHTSSIWSVKFKLFAAVLRSRLIQKYL